jgi:hypothetical protein
MLVEIATVKIMVDDIEYNPLLVHFSINHYLSLEMVAAGIACLLYGSKLS